MHSLSSLRQANSILRFSGTLSRTLSADFPGGENGNCLQQVLGNLATRFCAVSMKQNVSAPHAFGFKNFIHSTGQKDAESGRTSRPMDFVRGIVEEDGQRFMGSSSYPRFSVEKNADFVHIKLMRNNTFVTVTDSKGNKKIGASSGCLPELKGGPKMSRYAAEATAEHVGRLARNMGLKSVVMRVKGFTYFKKKRQAIMSFKEGFSNTGGDRNPIVYIEDTTRRPHNGCRLPKKRRI